MLRSVIILLLFCTSLFANGFRAFSNEKEVRVNLETKSFFQNNEFETNFTKGKTITGLQLLPLLAFGNQRDYETKLGVFVQKYSSVDKVSQSNLFFSTSVFPTNNTQILLGSYFEAEDFIAPLYSYEHQLTDRQKEGVLIKKNRKSADYSLWLDWRNFIFQGSSFQEEFTVGFSRQKTSRFNRRVFIPLQLLIIHAGGEIDTSEKPKKTTFNPVVGLSFSPSPQVLVENYFLSYIDGSNQKSVQISKGEALFSRIIAKRKFSKTELFFFYADRFYSEFGDPLFWSFSQNLQNLEKQRRRNVGINLSFERKITDDVNYSVKLNSNYDLVQSCLNYSYGIYIDYDLSHQIVGIGK